MRAKAAPVVDAPLELVERLAEAEQRLRDLNAMKVRRWLYDPARWVVDCVDCDGIAVYQEFSLRELVRYRRLAVRSLHGVGKTTTSALAVLWFATTRDLMGWDWKAVTTAGAWRQLEKFLWPEIHKWVRLLRFDVLGREPFDRTELLDLSLKLRTGEAFAAAASDPTLIEGAHADSIMYVYDESKSIEAALFDASEGAFAASSGKVGVLPEAFALAQSTPGDPEGRFFDIHTRKPGFEDWRTLHISLEEALAAGRVSQVWVNDRRRQWGETSQLFCNRVLGEFKASDGNSIIPLEWVDKAIERWHAFFESESVGEMTEVGIDVAREGDDATVLAKKYGHVLGELQAEHWDDTTTTAGWGTAVLDAHRGARAIVDVIGIGAGVYDMMRAVHRRRVVPFQAAQKTDRRDRSGEIGFANKRAAAWWNLRDILDPSRGAFLCLPPDDLLIADLTAPHWKMTQTGKVIVEPKADVKRRIGRSPDRGDATVMACWPAERHATMVHAGRVSHRR